jgi:glycosyltransferase involved in cell wall biosynthesis
MATAPYFVFSPSTVLSLVGLLHGPDKTVPTPAADWRSAVVDVVIPALNEQEHIVACLASVVRQTMKPRQVILVDDGSNDRTTENARAYAGETGLDLVAIKRRASIGKTPTLKRQARELDADVQLILDGDTVLESDNYIERVVQELYQGAGIASACGIVLPMRERDRRAIMNAQQAPATGDAQPRTPAGPRHGLGRAVTNLYRGVLYMFLQRFIYHGQMVFFGSIVNPVGCAVAYRRKYLADLFNTYEPILGDDLTNSEDIFIGFALLDQGYRNIQLMDVTARSLEPEIQNLPRQIYYWSSSFLQSCFYFDELLRSPFIALKRLVRRKKAAHALADHELREKRTIDEAYRQAFGIDYTRRFGRPMGWVLFLSMVEKITFPAALLIMILLRWWEPLAITLAAETVVSLGILTIVSRGQRLEMLGKGLLVTPIRYASLLFDIYTIARFAWDLWVTRNRRWRK